MHSYKHKSVKTESVFFLLNTLVNFVLLPDTSWNLPPHPWVYVEKALNTETGCVVFIGLLLLLLKALPCQNKETVSRFYLGGGQCKWEWQGFPATLICNIYMQELPSFLLTLHLCWWSGTGGSQWWGAVLLSLAGGKWKQGKREKREESCRWLWGNEIAHHKQCLHVHVCKERLGVPCSWYLKGKMGDEETGLGLDDDN